ncbi:MAG: DUF3575 domain-containing protein [Myxococcaceae bacterium]
MTLVLAGSLLVVAAASGPAAEVPAAEASLPMSDGTPVPPPIEQPKAFSPAWVTAGEPSTASPVDATVAAPVGPPHALESRRTAISLHLPALLQAALAVQAERYTASRRWSLALSLGARIAGGHDYRAFALASGAELRFWFFRPPSYAAAWGFGGPYAAVRLDVGGTRLAALSPPQEAGWGLTVGQTASVGYRLPLRGRIELTPSVGLGLTTLFDGRGRFAAFPRGVVVAGLTVGVLL